MSTNNNRQMRRAAARREERRLRKQNRNVTSEVTPVETAAAPPAAEPSPISDAKLAANRANSHLSTGPRTPEGKAASSRNNFRHGFTGVFTVLPNESADHFSAICSQLVEEHRPQTTTELMLVNDIARHYWLTQRALGLQECCIEASFTDPAAAKRLALYLRYQTTHQRAYHKCLQELRTMRREADRQAHREGKREAKSEPIGFESQNQHPAAEPPAELAVPGAFPTSASQTKDEHRLCPTPASIGSSRETASEVILSAGTRS